MSLKICLLSDHHLCINPRLWKEAFFYEKAGYEVVILTMWQTNDLLQRDLEILKGHQVVYKNYLNLIHGEINTVQRFCYRLRKRLANELQRIFKIGTGWAISHAPEKMYCKALDEAADMYAAHLECAFFTGRKLINTGKKVSFDFEDWYSRDYLTPGRAVKLLAMLELFAVQHGIFCTAASQSMADALMQTYPSSKKITTIYNSFPDEELADFSYNNVAEENSPFRLLWTSRTVGPERGLETLLEALRLLQQPVELHIIGKCMEGYEDYLKNNWPTSKGHILVFHQFIRHSELLQEIAGYDLGLAIESYTPDSRNKTITNKILQYLQAGIPVLATDTDGQKEVAGFFPTSVFTVPAGNPMLWKDQLEKLIGNSKPENRAVQLNTFKTIFSWPVQEQKLQQLLSENL